MRIQWLALLCGMLSVSMTLALRAQSKNDAKPEESVYAELGKAPEKYTQMRNPMASDPEAPAAGGVLFEEHCESCHGKEAVGGKKAPSLRAPEVQNAAPGAIFWILTNGVVRKKMPVWSKLPEPQRWQLVTYIQSLNGVKTESKASETKK
jgi:mono/diheme cytochrome c family protein